MMASTVNNGNDRLRKGNRRRGQSEFLVLMEDAIRQPDLSKSVQRYQRAVDEAKVRLGLCSPPWGLVNALAHAYQHSEHGWLQQSAQASDARYKAQSKQQHK